MNRYALMIDVALKELEKLAQQFQIKLPKEPNLFKDFKLIDNGYKLFHLIHVDTYHLGNVKTDSPSEKKNYEDNLTRCFYAFLSVLKKILNHQASYNELTSLVRITGPFELIPLNPVVVGEESRLAIAISLSIIQDLLLNKGFATDAAAGLKTIDLPWTVWIASKFISPDKIVTELKRLKNIFTISLEQQRNEPEPTLNQLTI